MDKSSNYSEYFIFLIILSSFEFSSIEFDIKKIRKIKLLNNSKYFHLLLLYFLNVIFYNNYLYYVKQVTKGNN